MAVTSKETLKEKLVNGIFKLDQKSSAKTRPRLKLFWVDLIQFSSTPGIKGRKHSPIQNRETGLHFLH